MFNCAGRVISLVCILSFLLMVVACGSKSGEQSGAQQQSSQDTKQYEEIPDEIIEIEANVEKVFELLEGPTVKTSDKKEESGQQEGQQGTQQDTQQQGTQQQGTQQGTQQQGAQQDSKQQSTQQSDQQQGNKQGAQQQTSTQDQTWKDLNSTVNNLHYQWNSFMPVIVKKGADMKILDSFGNSLNNLTKFVVAKDKTKTMTSANELYSHLADIFNLYNTKMSPEIKKLRYFIRNIILDSSVADWDSVQKDIAGVKSSWSILKNTLEEKQQQTSSKLDLSIYELEKVVAEKNNVLTDIKGRVALKNIEELEKSFKEESS